MAPKILFLDIETAPILGYVWQLWDQNVAFNQIHSDWYVLAWCAKWSDEKHIIYRDQRNAKNIENDSHMLKAIWTLLDAADIVITQNGKAFDTKKLNARFIINGMQPPSSYRQIDTLLLAKKHFAFTSNKLEYMTDKLCKKFKKLKHPKFNGFYMWKECLAGNIKAWKEMERYNKLDVLSLEELYGKLIPWDNSINFNTYTDVLLNECKCGNKEPQKYGFFHSNNGRFQRYKCTKCGSETRGTLNLLTKEKRKALKSGTPR